MSPTTEDPRNYIEIKPIPEWKEAGDSKLKARNLQNYTLEKPSREEVFKTNYSRRFNQLHSQGYNSAPWRPYQEVGKPLYLNTKVLVQGSLGQEAINGDKPTAKLKKESVDHLSSKHEIETKVTNQKVRAKSACFNQERRYNDIQKSTRPTSAMSYAAKTKQRQDHQSIVKDLNVLKESLVKVKMGHSLFSTLESAEDKSEKFTEFKQAEKQSLIPNENTRPSSVTFKQGPYTNTESRPSIASITSAGSITSTLVARQANVEKSVAEQARPFTPVHSNISFPVEEDDVNDRIWRQLCALHWVLQACQLETKSEIQRQHKVMLPISECWDTLNPGGKTRDYRALLEEKKNNTKWTKFTRSATQKLGASRARGRRKNTSYSYHLSASNVGGLRKIPSYASDMASLKKSASYGSELGTYREDISARQRRPSGLSVVQSVDIDDISIAKPSRPSSPGQSSVTTTIVGGTTIGSENGEDESNIGDNRSVSGVEIEKKNDHEDWFVEKDGHEHLKKLLSTVKQSVMTEMQRRERIAQIVAKSNKKILLSVYDWSRTSYFKIGKEQVNISRIVVPPATPVTDYSDPKPHKKVATPKIRPHTAVGTKRSDSNQTLNNDPSLNRPPTALSSPKAKRPMSSPAKLATQYNFKFSSAEKEKHLDEIRERFEEIGDTKTLQLHNQLLDLEKRRKQRMEIKFESIGRTSSMHRDLKGMRQTAYRHILSEKLASKKKSSTNPGDWYNALLRNLPYEIHSNSDCNVILKKLEATGIQMMEDVQKITSDSFLRALRTLRRWELCSPDVSSAVEFVRDVVVRMDPAEFDEWRATKLSPQDVIIGSDSKPK